MENYAFNLWLFLGILCLFLEFILPGLVVMFVGLGALTVVAGIHLGYVSTFLDQFLTFIISSTLYVFTLRFLIIRFLPTEHVKENINEDEAVIGEIAEVIESFDSEGIGRVSHSESTWRAKANSASTIDVGDKVKIIGRENITWIVEKV